jgi:hypothetical protein
MHYTTMGQATQDISKIGLVVAKNPPQTRYFFHAGPTASNLAIPPGDGNAEVVSELTLAQEAKLVYAQPHMHLRGKDFEYRVVYPTGEIETLLRVPGYNFNWQQWYYPTQPIRLPKGAKIECTAHFDNSPNNPSNPDPSTQVVWGEPELG